MREDKREEKSKKATGEKGSEERRVRGRKKKEKRREGEQG